MKDACKKQLEEYCSDLLSKYQYGFRQGYATQNCLLDMIEKLEIRKVSFAAVLNDLSKALDCNSQNLLTAKPSDYGFYRKSLIFILAYLKCRKQKTRIGLAFSDYLNILCGVPQKAHFRSHLIYLFLV